MNQNKTSSDKLITFMSNIKLTDIKAENSKAGLSEEEKEALKKAEENDKK